MGTEESEYSKPGDRRARRRNHGLQVFRRFLPSGKRAALVALVLLSVIAYAFKDPIMSGVREWRAKKLTEDAGEFASESRWQEARRASIAALQVKQSIEAIRLYYESARKLSDSQQLRIGYSLYRHPAATAGDKAGVLGHFVDAGDFASAETLEKGLKESEQEDFRVRVERLRLLLRTGKAGEALAFAAKAPEGEQARLDMVIAEALARTGDPQFRTEVAARLHRVFTTGNEELAEEAVILLAALPDGWIPRDLATVALERFEGADGIPLRIRLPLGVLEVGVHPERRAGVVARIRKVWDSDSALSGAWLLRLGEMERLMHLTKREGNDPPLTAPAYELRLRALEAMGKLDLLYKEMDNPPLSVNPMKLLARRALLAEHLGKKSEAASLWKKAFELAENDYLQNHFFSLAAFATGSGDPEIRLNALSLALEHRVGIPPAAADLEDVMAWLYQRGETERLFKVCQRLLLREPENPFLLNNYHYLLAVHASPSRTSAPVVEQLVKEHPDDPKFASTLAFVHLRAGRPERALEVLAPWTEKTHALADGEKAILAAVLVANRRRTAGRVLASEVNWEGFAPAETEVLLAYIRPARRPAFWPGSETVANPSAFLP